MLRRPCLLANLALAVAISSGELKRNEAKSRETFSCEHDYLLAYTLGKTGSSSFQLSMSHLCGRDFPWVYATQSSYPQFIKVQHAHEAAADFLQQVPSERTTWIVTVVRNPFERLISAFFQTQWCHYQVNQGQGGDGAMDAVIHDVHEHIANYDSYSYFEKWTNTTGMNPLSWSFDKKTQHIFAQGSLNDKPINVIVLRTEDTAEWDSILSQYFPGFVLSTDNISENKVYADLYEEFKREFRFTEAEVEFVMKQSAETHFYSQDEISGMVRSLLIEPADSSKLARNVRTFNFLRERMAEKTAHLIGPNECAQR